MAQKAHIVTPLTSALVLEHKADYTRYNVKQYVERKANVANAAPTNSFSGGMANFGNPIPTKPEPPMWLLVLCAMMIMAGLTWIKRKFKTA